MNKQILITLSLISIIGCSHTQVVDKQHTQNQIKETGEENPHSSISPDSFINSPDLSPGQKAQLKSIYGRVFAQSRMYKADLIEAKSKMFQLLSSKDYKSYEVSKLKKEIIEIDQKRLDLMFGALAEVQGVVGYGEDKEKIYRQLRDYDRHQSNTRMSIE